MIETQQPYIPVCLMTAAVMGTQHYHHLYHIRRFRDKLLGGKASSGSGLYYKLSEHTSKPIYELKPLKRLVCDLVVRPLGYLFKKLL